MAPDVVPSGVFFVMLSSEKTKDFETEEHHHGKKQYGLILF